ncbi:DUF1961 family protein [Ruania rhizosphaerae]|uniref:DUF1961 family protein n=1 Tax=Ruania rhizosphaerae TaxID=1840413 RepID=UPI00135B2E07|nr:DUF1961 family protein [Ruania rhizosphaerae]
MPEHPALGRTIYANPLRSPSDVDGFRMEGDGVVTFPQGRMRLESTRPVEDGQAANLVFWCPEVLPDRVAIRWKFWPIREPGLAIMFFAATGMGGENVHDDALARRTGEYPQYHSSDLRTLHVSYFRRKQPHERAFHTCNLRKSPGFHLVTQGGDPIPDVADADPPYTITVIKDGPHVEFWINALRCFTWTDDATTGEVLAGGQIGFRQMAPLIGEYTDLEVALLEEAAHDEEIAR